MNKKELSEAVYHVDESLVREAASLRLNHRKRRIFPLAASLAAAAGLLILGTVFVLGNMKGTSNASGLKRLIGFLQKEELPDCPQADVNLWSNEDECGNYQISERIFFPEEVQEYLADNLSDLQFEIIRPEEIHSFEEKELVSDLRRIFRLEGFNRGGLNIEVGTDSVFFSGDLEPLIHDEYPIRVLISDEEEPLLLVKLRVDYTHTRDYFTEEELLADRKPDYWKQLLLTANEGKHETGGSSATNPQIVMPELYEFLNAADRLIYFASAPDGCMLVSDCSSEGILMGSREQVITFCETEHPETRFIVRVSSERVVIEASLHDDSRIWQPESGQEYTFRIFIKNDAGEIRMIEISVGAADDQEI